MSKESNANKDYKAKKTILVADDMQLSRAVIKNMFCENYEVIEACNGEEALNLILGNEYSVDLVLLDIVMPVMDGFELLEQLHRRDTLRHLPVIMITVENSDKVLKKAYELGVTDIVTKPFNPSIVQKRVKNIMSLYSKQENLEEIVSRQTKALHDQSKRLADALSSIIEFKNLDAGQHIFHIRTSTKFFLQKMSENYPEYYLTPKQIEVISEAAGMHDIGKIAIPDTILNKPGRLTPEEYAIMQTHTIKGCEVAKKLRRIQSMEFMDYCMDICRHHHERWDGGGYPDGLKGDRISIWAQVVSLADVYDALTNKRVYKQAFSHEKALEMIQNTECGQFNPKLLSCLLANEKDFRSYLLETAKEDEMAMGTEQDWDDWDSQGVRNITDQTMRLLALEQGKYHMLADLSGDILFDYDVKRDLLILSDQFNKVFGRETVIENTTEFLRSPDFIMEEDCQALMTSISAMTPDQNTCTVPIRLKIINGGFRWFEVCLTSVWEEEAPCQCFLMMGKISNVHNHYAELEKWKHLASTDTLTGVLNRIGLEKKIKYCLLTEKGMPAALCMLDLDNFKQINDLNGHLDGDELLTKAAARIQSCIRYTDILGRIGGDEFVIFFRGLRSAEDIALTAQSICNILDFRGQGKNCTASLGVAIYPNAGETYESLLHHADYALYQSKKAGKNCFTIFDANDWAHSPMSNPKTASSLVNC